MKVIIIGAGPAGLGAALRLHKSGHHDWELWEADTHPGGLSTSVTDDDGFVWDLGGHVQFSHYKTFDDLMTQALGREGWIEHERECWVRIYDRWVPYPFQYNIHRLPKDKILECLRGLLAASRNQSIGHYANFQDLVHRCFGEGLARIFMEPYNLKVWAYPLSELDTGWIGERVALPNLDRIIESVVMEQDQVSWGPNNKFQFPMRGGTGAIWRAVAGHLPQDKIHYGRKVSRIDTERRTIQAEDGVITNYDRLITTLPLDLLGPICGLDWLAREAGQLMYSSTHVIGFALNGRPSPDLEKKCWMYFPEDNCPFYRTTVFSNYSPNNVPDINRYWSLMAEVSESPAKPVDAGQVVEQSLQGLLNTGLIERAGQVHHTWHRRIEHSYPTPSLGRDAILSRILPRLETLGIYSRGRFGAWKYEVGNQDHSMMQGFEVADRLLHDTPELTLWFPHLVNAMHPVYGKAWK